MKHVPGKTITHKEGNIAGIFGDIECNFDKARYEFLFGKKSQRKQMGFEYDAVELMKSIKTL